MDLTKSSPGRVKFMLRLSRLVVLKPKASVNTEVLCIKDINTNK